MFRQLLFVLLLASGSTFADSHRQIEQACTDLVLDYAYYRDLLAADTVAELFTEDAQMLVLGDEFVGRDAIRARLEAGRTGPLYRHLMSTIRIFVDSADHARGVSYVTVHAAPPGDLPRPLGQPVGVGEYHDEFVRTADGWKIKRREFVPVFMPEQ